MKTKQREWQDWLVSEGLTEEEAQLAAENLLKRGHTPHVHYVLNNFLDIRHAFVWESTPQGFDFWWSLYTRCNTAVA